MYYTVLKEGDIRVYGIAVLGVLFMRFFGNLILTCSIAVLYKPGGIRVFILLADDIR